MKDYFDEPIYEDDLAGIEDFQFPEDDLDEELYEDYIDDHSERFRFF